MTALMLFIRPRLVERIQWVQSAGAGVGLWDMGNKGAVGIRIGLSLENSDQELDITFIAAHLAPMEDAVQRRNLDWENIVRNLVFINDEKPKKASEDEEPLLSSSSDALLDNTGGLYAPGNYVFVAGDLNYRTCSHPPGPKAYQNYPRPVKSELSPSHFSHLLKSEQLIQELEAGRTLHGFQELPITFPPTYKYSGKREQPPPSQRTLGSSDEDSEESSFCPWAKHRYPSWCDRILFLPPSPSSPQLQPHSYTSLPLQPSSDHQPVALSLTIILSPLDQIEQARDLRSNPPFPINENWKSRRDAARQKEVAVGVLSYLVLTKSGNAILVATTGVIFVVWWTSVLLNR